MNVRDLTDSTYAPGNVVEVAGWLVIIDAKLFLLDENLADPYTESRKIEISNPLIIYPISDVISPLGGGESFIFHKSIILGVVENSPEIKIKVQDLLIEDDNREFVRVAIDEDTIRKAREKYGDRFLKKSSIKSKDWLDYSELYRKDGDQ